jgi:hypothetical protein
MSASPLYRITFTDGSAVELRANVLMFRLLGACAEPRGEWVQVRHVRWRDRVATDYPELGGLVRTAARVQRLPPRHARGGGTKGEWAVSKKKPAATEDRTVAMLRLCLEFYADPEKYKATRDNGERARSVLASSHAGEALAVQLRLLEKEVAALRLKVGRLEERLSDAERGEGEEVFAWRVTAEQYERNFRHALRWLKDTHGCNSWEHAADRHETLLIEHNTREALAARREPETLRGRFEAKLRADCPPLRRVPSYADSEPFAAVRKLGGFVLEADMV